VCTLSVRPLSFQPPVAYAHTSALVHTHTHTHTIYLSIYAVQVSNTHTHKSLPSNSVGGRQVQTLVELTDPPPPSLRAEEPPAATSKEGGGGGADFSAPIRVIASETLPPSVSSITPHWPPHSSLTICRSSLSCPNPLKKEGGVLPLKASHAQSLSRARARASERAGGGDPRGGGSGAGGCGARCHQSLRGPGPVAPRVAGEGEEAGERRGEEGG
jgi:hypothetical protein